MYNSGTISFLLVVAYYDKLNLKIKTSLMQYYKIIYALNTFGYRITEILLVLCHDFL